MINKLKYLYNKQIVFQEKITGLTLPHDSPYNFRDHICLMAEELGELAKTDKRWRQNMTETKPDGYKLDELADIFIVAMNLSIFSGCEFDDLFLAIKQKMKVNEGRLVK